MKFATFFQHQIEIIPEIKIEIIPIVEEVVIPVIEIIPEIKIEIIPIVEEIVIPVIEKVEIIPIVEEVVIPVIEKAIETITLQIEEIKIEETKIEIPIEEEVEMDVVETSEGIIEELFESCPEFEIIDETLIEDIIPEPEIKIKNPVPVYESKKNKRKTKYNTLKQAYDAKLISSTETSSDKSFRMNDVYQEFDDIPDEFTA